MPGATNFPVSVDNNVELTDGVDIIQADDQNHSYAAIDAIEAYIGPSGAAQSHNTDVLEQLLGVLPTMIVSWKDADTLEVSAGRVVCSNAAGSLRKMRKNSAVVDVSFTDIDTGSRLTNTQYYVYAVADAASTQVTFKISANATTPTGPTTYKKIAKFRTNGTGAGEIIKDSVLNEGFFNNTINRWTLVAAVNFNGTGTPAITKKFNVSSIGDSGAGQYAINFEYALDTADYLILGLCQGENWDGVVSLKQGTTPSTTSCQIVTQRADNGVLNDATKCFLAFVTIS